MRSLPGPAFAGLIAVIALPVVAAVGGRALAAEGGADADAGAAPAADGGAPVTSGDGGAPVTGDGGAAEDAGATPDAGAPDGAPPTAALPPVEPAAPSASTAAPPPSAPPPSASTAPSTAPPVRSPPPAAPPRHQPEAPPPQHDRWLGVGVTVGFIDENESVVHVVDLPGGAAPPAAWLTRGGWIALEGEYLFDPSWAVAGRVRAGSIERGPATVPSRPLATGADPRLLDPQLGDSKAGGSVAGFVRLFPGHVALDFGGTLSFTSFRPRLTGDKLEYASATCQSCPSGQDGFRGMDFWPTVRVSSTGPGFFYAVDTGESFVQTNEPGVLEVLVGRRGRDVDVMGGLARGLALRIDGRVSGAWWLSLNASYKPWGDVVAGHGAERMIGALTLTRRFSGLAPL